MDLFRPFRCPENEIEVLRPVKSCPQPAKRAPQAFGNDKEMAHVVHAAHQVRAETGLEERLNAPASFIKNVLVGIQYFDIRVNRKGSGNLEQREGCQRVIVVKEPHKSPLASAAAALVLPAIPRF